MSRVVIVAPVHIWDDVRVFKKQAVSLAGQGFDVVLLARSKRQRVEGGVQVLPPYGSHRSRLIRFASLPLIALQALLLRGDVYHLHNPDTIPIAVVLKLFRRKVIYDTHEDFTERISVRSWMPRQLRGGVAWAVGILEALTGRLVDAAIATQPEVASRLGAKCVVIENPPRFDELVLACISESSLGLRGGNAVFRLVYIGGISEARGLYDMIDALVLVNQSTRCRLWLIGPANSAELERAKERDGWQYVDYFPKMEQQAAFGYVSAANAGLIYLHDVGGHSTADPNKIYEYMALQCPFIASDFEKWRDKLEGVNAGIFVRREDAQSLAAGILQLARLGVDERKKMGLNGRRYAAEHNWDFEFTKVLEIYLTLLGPHTEHRSENVGQVDRW